MNIQYIHAEPITDLGSEPNLQEDQMNIFDDAPQNQMLMKANSQYLAQNDIYVHARKNIKS